MQPWENQLQLPLPLTSHRPRHFRHISGTSSASRKWTEVWSLWQLPTGEWYECIPLASPELISIVQDVQGSPVDVLFSGDGLSNPRYPSTLSVYHLFNQSLLHPTFLQGKHLLLCFPRPLPFEDQAPVFSFRSWCQLAREVLTSKGVQPSRISILLQSRHQSPTPQILPLLDRRFEMDPLRLFWCPLLCFLTCPWTEGTHPLASLSRTVMFDNTR